MNRPEDQLRAGHLPADLIPDGVDPRHVHVTYVIPERRSFVAPVVLILTASFGVGAVVWVTAVVLMQLAAVAAAAASAMPALLGGVGVTVVFRKSR